MHQIAQLQTDPIHNQQYQLFGHGLTAAAGAIHTSCRSNQRSKFFALLLTFAGFEHRGDITMCAIRPCKQIVFRASNIRPQRTFGFAAARILRAFILPGIVVEDVLVGRRHHRLQRIQHGGFARAGRARQQGHVAHRIFIRAQCAPVHQDQFFQLHSATSSFSLLFLSPCSASLPAVSATPSASNAATRASSLIIPSMVGRMAI